MPFLSLFRVSFILVERAAKIARALMHLASAYWELGDNNRAKELLEQILKIYENHVSEDPLGVVRTLAYLGNALRRLGDYEKAKTLLEQSLVTYKNHFPENHVEVTRALAHLGDVHMKLGNFGRKYER